MTLKKKVIIIEGPDNVGKTTLANMLAKEHSAFVRHWGPPPGDGNKALKYQLDILDDELDELYAATKLSLEIWDRSIVGESVYGPLYRNYDNDKYWDRLLGLRIFERQVFLIVLYADKEFYKSRGIKPKVDEKVKWQTQDAAKKIAVRFVDVASDLGLKNTLYVNCHNYKSFDARNAYILRRVNRWLSNKPFEFVKTNDYSQTFFNLNHRLWKPNEGFIKDPHYRCDDFKFHECKIADDFRKLRTVDDEFVEPIGAVGATEGIRFLFVGESSGYNESGPQMCHPFYNGASGCLFQSALTSLGIHPVHYYLTNVVKCNPKDNQLSNYVNRQTRPNLECVGNLFNEISDIAAKNVGALPIAFGKVASEELSRLKINFVTCYHPSYYLRMGVGHRFVMDLRAIIK